VPRKDLALYLRLLRQAKPYWKIALVSVLAVLASAGLEPFFPALMQPLVDKSLILKDSRSLWQVPLFIFVVFLLKGLADYIFSVSSQYLAQKVTADLRSAVFSAQLDLPIADHRAEDGGRMLTRITNEAGTAGEVVATTWLVIIRDSLVVLGLVGFLFYTAWQLALLVLVLLPVLALVIHRANKKIRGASEKAQAFMGRLSGLIEESLKNIQDIKIFGALFDQSDRFNQISKALRHENMRVARIQALNVPLVQITAALCVSVVVYVASYLSRLDALTPGQFVSFITAMSMVFEPIRRLANVNATIQRGLAAAESLFGVLDRGGEIVVPKRGQQKEGCFECRASPFRLTIRNLSYSYTGRGAPVLRNLSFEGAEGEKIAIIGPSGSGKSTLVSLICGFDEHYSGSIQFNGIDIRSLPLGQVRQQISLVGQSVNLFDLSVRENLCLGGVPKSDAEVMAALKNSNAWDFVKDLPLGLETKLGFHGSALSGGQRQRLAIARAFLKNAPILIFDEPTSALDSENEQDIFEAISRISEGRLALFISHSDIDILAVDKVVSLTAPGP
jgi:subfamily B ATP-binding cassette protein MsbA